MSFRRIVILAVCLLSTHTAFNQSRVSPQLIDKKFRFEANKTLLTISVADTQAFQKKYVNKINLFRRQPIANCFILSLRQQGALEDLKKDPNVIFIDHHQQPKEESVLEYANWNFNRITKLKHFFPDLKGANQTLSVKEQGFDPIDIDLVNRSFTTSVTPAAISQHATAMTTFIAGGGNSSLRSQGVAWQARFTSSDFASILPDPISIFNANNIHVQNHSYGIGIENYYGNEAFAYDQQVIDKPSLLHVFSAGNSGKLKPPSGTYVNMEFATLTGNFKQAKNVLVVNAVDTTLNVSALNSRGPAYDGRLKPELTAYGQDGTSDAAAIVSGISLLLQEKHQRIHQSPADASLIKAVLIASADEIGAPGIDYVHGYGSVNAYKALRLMDLNQTSSITLASNEEVILPITIPVAIAEFKIAITWTDPPAIPNATKVLMNNIDSWLDNGSGIILPWVLNSFPHVDSLQALPKRKKDDLNTTEYITLANPIPGTYQLHLKSGILTSASQKVSVAYWLQEEKIFSWDFPLANDLVDGGEKNLLMWEAAPDKKGDLYLQEDNQDWQLIQSNIDLKNYFYWTSPAIFSKAKLKIKIGTDEFITDEFIISPAPKMKAAFICADSIGLSWNAIQNATSYEVYTMDSQYLKQIATTTDTVLVLSKPSVPFFSVTPLSDAIAGSRSKTIDYTQQGALCYLNLFTAERTQGDLVSVKLNISSWYQVDQLTIFKTSDGNKSIFKTITDKKSLSFTFNDTNLPPGLLTYQAEIVLQNGSKIQSDLIDIFIEEKGRAIIYPNPVTSSSDLTILSAGGGLKFRILDLLGRTIIEKELELVEDAIDVVRLPAGVYLYHVVSSGRVTDTGKFIKY